jgi:hydrogenase maturation protease
MPEPVLVVGVGNPYRRDDGFGVAVLDRLRELKIPGIQIVEESGEPAALVARWTGHSVVIMVDALASGATPGTIHRLECGGGVWDLGDRTSAASTHGLGVADAIELAKVLDQLPARLVIFGAETQDVSNGPGLSDVVAAAVDPVAREIVHTTSALLRQGSA